MSGADLVRCTGVSKRFTARAVLRDVTFDLRAGEVLSVTGPNGAGKSTLLRVVAGTYLPDGGVVELAGIPTTRGAARQQVATSYNDDRSWYGRLSAWENLRFWQSVRGLGTAGAAELVEALGLAGMRDTPVAVLSSGQRARLGVVRALAAASPVVVLDEPTRAVDAEAAAAVASAVCAASAAGRVVVVATHDDLLRERIGGRRLTLSLS